MPEESSRSMDGVTEHVFVPWLLAVWRFPKMGIPQSSSIWMGFAIINHPFWSILGIPHLCKPPFHRAPGGPCLGFFHVFSPENEQRVSPSPGWDASHVFLSAGLCPWRFLSDPTGTWKITSSNGSLCPEGKGLGLETHDFQTWENDGEWWFSGCSSDVIS